MQAIGRGILSVLAVLVTACGSSTAPREADLVGTVLEVTAHDTHHVMRLMRAGTTAGGADGEVLVHVTASTRVLVPVAGGRTEGTIADVPAGARVLVQTAGVEYRSLPPQYQALSVELNVAR